jgi:hypothetical protein
MRFTITSQGYYHCAEGWTVAATEGLVICMRGNPVYFHLPDDLVERMMDYVLHVQASLALLVDPGTVPKSAEG